MIFLRHTLWVLAINYVLFAREIWWIGREIAATLNKT